MKQEQFAASTFHKQEWKWRTLFEPASKLLGRKSSCRTDVTLRGSSMTRSSDSESRDQTYSNLDRPPPTNSFPSLQKNTSQKIKHFSISCRSAQFFCCVCLTIIPSVHSLLGWAKGKRLVRCPVPMFLFTSMWPLSSPRQIPRLFQVFPTEANWGTDIY